MTETQYEIVARPLARLDREEAVAIGALIAAAFPRRGAHERAEQLLAMGELHALAPKKRVSAPVSLIVREGDSILAHALVFGRLVRVVEGDESGRELPVLALAKVASDPEHRGQGLGALVVRAALSRVGQGPEEFCVLQTTDEVRPFYEKLGAVAAENRFVNSLDPAHPESSPFWDEVVMRYPAEGAWPTGKIDLLGPGF